MLLKMEARNEIRDLGLKAVECYDVKEVVQSGWPWTTSQGFGAGKAYGQVSI